MPKKPGLTFSNLGNNDGMQYKHADMVKLCRVNDLVAFSFYQMDYQAVVNRLLNNPDASLDNDTIPTSKVVMPLLSLFQLQDEVEAMVEKLATQGILHPKVAKAKEKSEDE